jgi:superfamily II DNA helicase RecQ
MLLAKTFRKVVLRNREFTRRCLAVVVDEAHVVSHWGHNFRKQYSEIGLVRAFLRKETPMVALSATLTPRVWHDIMQKLDISTHFVRIDQGNDRPNVAIVVRAMQYAANSYADLGFAIPVTVTRPEHIPSTFIYADNVVAGTEIVDYLEAILPPNLRGQSLVWPYSAAFSQAYRSRVMELFKEGEVRLLVCTDAAGMVCPLTLQLQTMTDHKWTGL